MESGSVPTVIFGDTAPLASASSSRRHSFGSSNLRDYAPSELPTPIKVLARSITQGTLELRDGARRPTVTLAKTQKQFTLIDLKFVDLYVKKGRQNSEAGLVKPTPVLAKRLSPGSKATGACRAESVDGKSSKRLPAVRENGSTNLQVPTRKLHGSSSDSNLRNVSCRDNIGGRSPTLVTCYRILESLYVGGANAAFNNALLKRLNIDYFIDLRKRPARQGTANSISPLPPTSSGRKALTLRLDQASSRADLESYFHQIDTFITKARLQGKNVLLYDDDGRSEAPAAIVQYLMHYYKMRYSEAKDFVSHIIPEMQMPPRLEQALASGPTDGVTEEAPKSGHSHQTANGSSQCRNLLKHAQQKKPLAWA